MRRIAAGTYDGLEELRQQIREDKGRIRAIFTSPKDWRLREIDDQCQKRFGRGLDYVNNHYRFEGDGPFLHVLAESEDEARKKLSEDQELLEFITGLDIGDETEFF